jgi:hypothetical protein
MDVDVLQRIYEYAGYDERICIRVIFKDVEFRIPKLRESTLVVDCGSVSANETAITCAIGPYTIKKTTCYFCNFQRIETVCGMETLGATCVLPWCIPTGLCARGRIHAEEEDRLERERIRVQTLRDAWKNRKKKKRL